MQTILVADDHPMFRAAMLQALREALPGARMIEAASQSAVENVLAEQPDIDLVLLDLAMPGAMGFSSLVLLRGERPEVPVIVISSNDHPRTVRRAQQFGATGFVSKSAPVGTLGDAVREVLAGGSWFAAEKAERSEQDAALAAKLAQLTPQQLRVLMLLAEGLLNKQIADQLGLAENTVKIHVTAVLRKLDCRSRTQAAVLVKSLDLDESPSSGLD
ncbi:two component transcriptional regulator, LuxR family [Dyella sp. OK004]|uniref:response regulator n=1 Tax=Dyella sp. OK004 TaxID=1855292 RepID=UPI0008EC3DCF|nr:response regulator transcription factor [Dyella sp. OK004]SFS04071.1 two component transcriptional regulator, LuxR family [Dyella sp. OK004]